MSLLTPNDNVGGKGGVLIIISDGEFHGEGTDELLELARDRNILVHCAAIGTEKGVVLTMPTAQGLETKLDEEGKEVVTRRHSDVLQSIASASGGMCWSHSADMPADRSQIIQGREQFVREEQGRGLAVYALPVAFALIVLSFLLPWLTGGKQ